MPARNLAWLRTEVSRKLNHNSGQTDQDFAGTADDANADIDTSIAEAYDCELEEAMQNTDPNWFKEADESVIWPASSATLTLPDFIAEADVLLVHDVTNDAAGIPLWIVDQSADYTPEIFPQSRNVWRWGTTGPSAATTLRITYLPAANEMNDPSDEPRYIPPRFRWILVWSAAIIGRQLADEAAPGQWLAAREEWRQRWHMAISKGRPRGTNRARSTVASEDIYS